MSRLGVIWYECVNFKCVLMWLGYIAIALAVRVWLGPSKYAVCECTGS